MSIYQLRSSASSLDRPEETEVNGQEAATGEEADGTVDGTANAESAQEDGDGEESQELRAQALRALLLARRRTRPSENAKRDSSDVEATDESEPPSTAAAGERKSSVKRSRVLDSDDDDDDDDGDPPSRMDVDLDGPSADETRSAPAKRRRHRVLSDDEDEE